MVEAENVRRHVTFVIGWLCVLCVMHYVILSRIVPASARPCICSSTAQRALFGTPLKPCASRHSTIACPAWVVRHARHCWTQSDCVTSWTVSLQPRGSRRLALSWRLECGCQFCSARHADTVRERWSEQAWAAGGASGDGDGIVTPGKPYVRFLVTGTATSADTLGDGHAEGPAAATACPVAR